MPTLRVQLEERDYVNATQAAARPSTRTVILFAVASALVIVGAVVGWRAGYEREAFIGGFVWCGALIGAWIGHMVQSRRRRSACFASSKG